MSIRYACGIGDCSCDYSRRSSLRSHQRTKHAAVYEAKGLIENVKNKRRKTTNADNRPVIEQTPIPTKAEAEANHIEILRDQIRALQAKQKFIVSAIDTRTAQLRAEQQQACQDIGRVAGQQATLMVETILDDMRSEMMAHLTDLRERQTLLAKKTTKWCVICFERAHTTAFLPCGHKCACAKCADNVRRKYKACPICRRAIKTTAVIYDVSEV